MYHRHLNHQRLTIDDIIARGQQQDWVDLRQAVLADRALQDRVVRVCQPYLADPYAQRYHFWTQYVAAHQDPVSDAP